MSIFRGSGGPAYEPEIGRQDLFDAVVATSRNENAALTQDPLSGALPEIEYLSDVLPDGDDVIAVAHCMTTSQAVQSGVIAFTAEQVIAVVGFRGPRGEVTDEEPWVYARAFRDLSNLSWNISDQWCLAYFDTPGQPQIALHVGRDKAWRAIFVNAMHEQYHRVRSSVGQPAPDFGSSPQPSPPEVAYNYVEMSNGTKYLVPVEFNALVTLVDEALKAGGILALPTGRTAPGTPRMINPSHIVEVIDLSRT